MVLFSCARLVLRRLALRKGLALTAACLFVLGVVGLMNLAGDEAYGREGGRTRTIRVPTLPSKGLHTNFTLVGQHKSTPDNRSSSPSHPPPLSINNSHNLLSTPIHRRKNATYSFSKTLQPASVYVISNTTFECLFSAAQPTPGSVDVQMENVFDRIPFDNPTGGVWKQGFEITYSMDSYQQEPLQVFVVPHSHNDPGWLRVFEDYYRRQTRSILNLVTDALTTDSRRRFIWAEISFLALWWAEQNELKRTQFKKCLSHTSSSCRVVVAQCRLPAFHFPLFCLKAANLFIPILLTNGQIEIVTGGWVMNDEANTHYFAMIDQMMEGHQWLQNNLPGVIPRSSWAIDPFGHTPTMAYLLQRMGLESMLIQRVHYSVKKHLARHKQLEFAWRQLWDQGPSTDIFCHMMPFYSYDIPHSCGPDPKICCQFDFKRLPGNKMNCPWKIRPEVVTEKNVAAKAEMLADQYRKKAQLFRTKMLLVPLGDDFRFDTQREVDAQFSNYHKLIDYINSHPEMRMHVQFAVLSEYFSAVRRAAGGEEHGEDIIPSGFPSLAGDFYTYSDRGDHYWSGYFTSRPFYKSLDRVLETNLRSAEILYSLVIARGLTIDPNIPQRLTTARRALGLFQHHDGITGTAKEPVVVDYAKKMTEALTLSKNIMALSAQTLLMAGKDQEGGSKLILELEETFPSSDSPPAHKVISLGSTPTTVTFFNPLPHSRTQLVALRVNKHNVMVRDADNAVVSSQVNPVWMDKDNIATSEFEVLFVVQLGPLSLTPYKLLEGGEGVVKAVVQFINQRPAESTVFQTEQYPGDDFVLSTDHLEARFSGHNGLLKSLSTGHAQVTLEVDFVTYGTRSGKERSGAYLFLPDGEGTSILSTWHRPFITIIAGPLFQEVRSSLGLVTHSVQLHNSPGVDGRSIAIVNTVDIRKENNKEVAMRLKTSVQNKGRVFYTDVNGYQLVRRRTVDKLPLQGNFYPMPTSAVLQDKNTRLSLLSGQPLGVGALQEGWLEVMLDRRLMQDDQRGLGQGLKDNKVTSEKFRLLVEQRLSNSNPAAVLVYPSILSHFSLDHLLHPLQALLSPPNSPLSHLRPLDSLTSPFPCDLHLVNLRSILSSEPTPSSAALILYHRAFDCGFNMAPLQCEVNGGKIKLAHLFKGVDISEAMETTLTLLHDRSTLSPESQLTTQIDPMDIHTYRLTW